MRKPTGRESGHFRGDGTPKKPHPSRRSAERAAEYLRKVFRTKFVLDVYPCTFCHHWHVGRERSRRH
jgi:hypothetical protein